MNLTPDNWRQLQDLFARALAERAEDRAAFLDRETNGDLDLRRELEGMLAHDASGGQTILKAIEHAAGSAAETSWLDHRFGPYRIVREIGRGGMGIVFEAVRDDQEYSKTVALKVAPWWHDSEKSRDRFRDERQILAALEHPNIARFLDGGSEKGMPYFVMEYVHGELITDHCRNLPFRDRINLFRQVCNAVHYAHENLIVHRDLKPANILVGKDGVPKLLDFGIAKLLGPAKAAQSSATGALLMTPDYTSPEQLLGRAVTTRSDVYSLGLILYEMLTDERAQTVDTSSPGAQERSICETEPEPASVRVLARGDRATARQLFGDLDNIIAKAIAKEPEQRYKSASDLEEDLTRFLDGRPVRACAPKLTYRLRKFLGRHRAAVLVGALVLAIAATGLTTTIYQARRAQRRFDQVRKLANEFVFNVHDKIVNLPGSMEARKSIVQTALSYLENLRQDAHGDPSLQLELAGAYVRIGDAQGDPLTSNLGDPKGAMVSYQRARELLEKLPVNQYPEAEKERATILWSIAKLHRQKGDEQGAMASLEDARKASSNVLNSAPADREAVVLFGQIESDRMRIMSSRHDVQGVTKAAGAIVEVVNRASKSDPGNPELQNNASSAYAAMATAQITAGDIEGAVASYRNAVRIREQICKDNLQHAPYQRNLLIAYGMLGDFLGVRTGENLGDMAGAGEALRKAVAIAEYLGRVDPADRRAQYDLVMTYSRLGFVLAQDRSLQDEGMARLEDAYRILMALQKQDPQNYTYRYYTMYMDRRIGEEWVDQGRMQEGEVRLRRAGSEAASLLTGPDAARVRFNLSVIHLKLAELYAKTGGAQAGSLADTVAADLKNSPRLIEPVWNEAQVSGRLGKVYRRLGRSRDAVTWLERSARLWREMHVPKALESRRQAELNTVELVKQ